MEKNNLYALAEDKIKSYVNMGVNVDVSDLNTTDIYQKLFLDAGIRKIIEQYIERVDSLMLLDRDLVIEFHAYHGSKNNKVNMEFRSNKKILKQYNTNIDFLQFKRLIWYIAECIGAYLPIYDDNFEIFNKINYFEYVNNPDKCSGVHFILIANLKKLIDIYYMELQRFEHEKHSRVKSK